MIAQPELCIYCKKSVADTRDHVPPELLFPSPKPGTLVTVPACRACNGGFQKDDEVFALMLTSLLDVNAPGHSIYKSKIAGGLFERSPKLRKVLGSTLHYLPHTLPGGRQGLAPAILIERDRILRVLRRIVRGLSWHEYGSCDFSDDSVRILTDAELQVLPVWEARRLSARYGFGTARIIAPDVFEYHHATAAGRVDCSAWWLIFYGSTRFLAIVNDGDAGAASEESARDGDSR